MIVVWMILCSVQDECLNSHEGDISKENLIFVVQPYTLALVDPILLDELPPYFHYYSTQVLGHGTVADVVTRAFSNMRTAARKKKNVCIVVSDLTAAYDTGGKLIQRALNDATQELGRAEVSIIPVNLEFNEIYEILRKRLFTTLPDKSRISDIAAVYASRLAEAARARPLKEVPKPLPMISRPPIRFIRDSKALWPCSRKMKNSNRPGA